MDHTKGIALSNVEGHMKIYTLSPGRRGKRKTRLLRDHEVIIIELSTSAAERLRNLVLDPGEFNHVLQEN